MQFMIDTTTENAKALRIAAAFLVSLADSLDGLVAAPAIPPAPPVPVAPPFIPPPPHAANIATAPAPSAAAIPNPPTTALVPPAPPHAGMPAIPVPPPPAPSNVTAIPTALNAASLAPTAPPAAPIPPPPGNVGSQPDVLDSSGMPWDARIHQKGKSTKKDGTWKLQKNIDVALVTAVTQELHARMINSTAAAPPQHPAAPPAPTGVSVPPPPPPGAVPLPPPGAVPPPPVYDLAGSVPPVNTVMGTQPVPVPQAPHVGMPDAANAGVVQPVGGGFRELVAKITNARNAGKLTADEVTSIVMQSGAPSLQLLGSMSHLVPVVDAYIDAVLATR